MTMREDGATGRGERDRIVLALRARRRALRWTQRDLGDLMGVKQCVICQYERGHSTPNLGTLIRWAQALGVALQIEPVVATGAQEYAEAISQKRQELLAGA